MQVSVEQTSPIRRQMTVVLASDQVQTALNREVQTLQRQKSMPGFRAGQIPVALIQERFSAEIKGSVLNRLIGETLTKALEQLSLTPVGRPELYSAAGLEQVPPHLDYKVQFDIYPEIVLPDFKTLEVEKMTSEITESDIDKLIEKISTQSSKTTTEPEDPVRLRQQVRDDLEKKLDFMSREQMKTQILHQLLKACPIPLPQVMVEDEIHRIHTDLHQKQGDGKTSCDHQHDGLEAEAKRRVQLSLLFREIVKLNQLVLDEEKVKEKINQIAKAYGNADLIKMLYDQSNELLEQIRRAVLVEQVMDFMIEQVSVKTKTVAMDDLLEV